MKWIVCACCLLSTWRSYFSRKTRARLHFGFTYERESCHSQRYISREHDVFILKCKEEEKEKRSQNNTNKYNWGTKSMNHLCSHCRRRRRRCWPAITHSEHICFSYCAAHQTPWQFANFLSPFLSFNLAWLSRRWRRECTGFVLAWNLLLGLRCDLADVRTTPAQNVLLTHIRDRMQKTQERRKKKTVTASAMRKLDLQTGKRCDIYLENEKENRKLLLIGLLFRQIMRDDNNKYNWCAILENSSESLRIYLLPTIEQQINAFLRTRRLRFVTASVPSR